MTKLSVKDSVKDGENAIASIFLSVRGVSIRVNPS